MKVGDLVKSKRAHELDGYGIVIFIDDTKSSNTAAFIHWNYDTFWCLLEEVDVVNSKIST
jgi:hypothetical protein